MNFADRADADDRAVDSRQRRPVFLHTGWRSSGTWLWSKFSRFSDVAGYYEPLHEVLADIDAPGIAALGTAEWSSGHPTLDRPYFAAFTPLLGRRSHGVRGYQPAFAMQEFFQPEEEAAPRLRGYLESLLDRADRDGRQAVLKFCRSLGRVGWMRRCFPDAAHVVLARNPISQFVSARRQWLDHANPYFVAAPLRVLACNAGNPRVAEALDALDVPVAALGRHDDAGLSYRGFLAFWLLCALSVPDHGVLFIDGDMLVMQPAYRAAARDRLAAVSGREIDLGDARGAPTARAIRPWLGLTGTEVAACHHAGHGFLARHATARQMDKVVRMLALGTMLAVGCGQPGPVLEPPLTDPFADSIALRRQLGEERRRRLAADAAVAAMRRSTSWRLTSPLRAAGRLLAG